MSKSSLLSHTLQLFLFFWIYIGSFYLGQFHESRPLEILFFIITFGLSFLWILIGALHARARTPFTSSSRKIPQFLYIFYLLWLAFFLVVAFYCYPLTGFVGAAGISVLAVGTSLRYHRYNYRSSL